MGCKAGDTCLFPQHKIDEQQNKKLQKAFKNKEIDDKNTVAVVKIVPTIGLRLARLRSIGFSKRKGVRETPDAKKSWD